MPVLAQYLVVSFAYGLFVVGLFVFVVVVVMF
jgi:hypothetical protein